MSNETKYSRFGIWTSIRERFLRVGKARGFGIQSPWAYSFVTEVVGERLPYYGYDAIDSMCRDRRERRFQKLMLRLRNFVHPHQVAIFGNIFNMSNDDAVTALIESLGSESVIVVRDIWQDSDTLNRWYELQQREDVGITFDLYSFGIIFLDTTIYKQHYSLNF